MDEMLFRLRDVPQGEDRPLFYDTMEEAAVEIERLREALQRIHRLALAAEGAGYDLILSITEQLVSRDSGRLPKGEDAPAAECEASQSGAATDSASPETPILLEKKDA